ncbi:hypothetical protein [Nocardiopsis dassonvillei]|uniref:hypothetical protein n=1 Tax=Nocardiopsis dassonvillei TaxID=2014 RepID=UPI003671B324
MAPVATAPAAVSAPTIPAQGRLPLIPQGEMAVALNVSPMPTNAPDSVSTEQIAAWVRTGYDTLGEFHIWWCDYVARKLSCKVATGEATAAQVGIYRAWFPSEDRYDTAVNLAYCLYNRLPDTAKVRDHIVYLDMGDVMGDGCSYQFGASARDVEMANANADRVREQLAMTGGALPIHF